MRRLKSIAIMIMLCVFVAGAQCKTVPTNSCAIKQPPPLNNPAVFVRTEAPTARWRATVDQFGKDAGCWSLAVPGSVSDLSRINTR